MNTLYIDILQKLPREFLQLGYESYSKVISNWPIRLCHRKWSSDLMLETVRCWLKPFTTTEYSPGMKKCHSWGTPLFVGLVVVQVICVNLVLNLISLFGFILIFR